MIADSFVFFFAPFETLHQLNDWGMLDRERLWLDRVAGAYKRIVVMTYGDATDHELLDLLPTNTALVCNEAQLDTAEYLGTVPGRIATILDGTDTAVVRTHQMWHGDAAANTAEELRSRDIRTGLIARCGYVWSQFVARSQGPAAPRVVEARQVEGEVCRSADIVVATTQRMLDDLCWAHAVDPAKTRLVPNFVFDDRPPANESGRDPREILYTGRFTSQKRLDLLIDAVALLPRDRNAHLRLIGQGELEADLRERADARKISVTFAPRIPNREMLLAMERCGVYAQTSAYEGHPRTVIEAMSTGAPTLITDTDGQGPEVIDGETGIKAAMTPESIAAGLDRLLRDRVYAGSLGANAAADVRARFGLSALLPSEFAVHREALDAAGSRSPTVSGSVRFTHPLLHANAKNALDAWSRSVECFARRMDPNERDAFLSAFRAEIDALAALPPATSETDQGHPESCAV